MRDLSKFAASIEAFLFVKGEPVKLKELSEVFKEDTLSIQKGLDFLKEKYQREDSGITLYESGAGWRLATKSEYNDWLTEVLGKEQTLSSAALETLAVVACKEPVTRADIEKVRGVSVGRILSTLIEKGLIEERGRLNTLGSPILYGTTRRFLACTGLSDLSELRSRWSSKPEEGELF